MRNTFFLMLLGFISQISYGQSYSNPYTPPVKVDVTVKKDPNDFSTSFNQGMQAGAAARQAAAANNAAYDEAMKNNYSKILIDNLVNNTNQYEYVFLENISGWKSGENKRDILKILKGANKFQIIDERKLPSEFIGNPKILFISWLREAQGENTRVTQLSIKNFEGKLIYESLSKNLSHQEILKPLISNYSFTKEMALSKIEELKKYLDLGIITKEEYDLKVAELKPILIGNN
jgi:hypothetical protein